MAEDLTFRSDAIENARSDVLREMADKKLGNDIFANYVAAVAPKSANDLIDAQNSDGVPGADVGVIRGLYRRVYRPENTTFVIVGNVDPAIIVSMLQQRFGSWQGVGPISPANIVTNPAFENTAGTSYSALPYGRNIALLTSTTTLKAPGSRQDQMAAQIMEMIAMRAVGARMAGLYSDYPEGKYGFYIDNGSQDYHQMMFWDDFVPGRWREATTKLLQLKCSITLIGLSNGEVRQAAESVVSDLSNTASAVADTPNSWLAKELADATTSKRELISPREMFEFSKKFASNITATELKLWWQRTWSDGTHHLRVESPLFASSQNTLTEINTAVESVGAEQRCKF